MNVRQQFGALCYRLSLDREVEFLLITSRVRRRWIIPKGWPMRDKPPRKAAAREAVEEAGVKGRVSKMPIGSYVYDKELADGSLALCNVDVFALEVRRELNEWAESGQRERRWFARADAAEVVDDDGLVPIILAFAPNVA